MSVANDYTKVKPKKDFSQHTHQGEYSPIPLLSGHTLWISSQTKMIRGVIWAWQVIIMQSKPCRDGSLSGMIFLPHAAGCFPLHGMFSCNIMK
jgi:hypothetical protein